MYRSTSVNSSQYTLDTAPNRANGMACAVITTTLLLSGTGSTFTIDDHMQWLSYVQPKIHQEFKLGEDFYLLPNASESNDLARDVEVRTTSQHLENIRNIMSPSMSELAKDLGVTRQALYKWVSGEYKPDNEANEEYILTLSKIADEFARSNVSNVKDLVKVKAFEGKTLIDLVKSGGDWSTGISLLIAEAKARDIEYQQVMNSSIKTKPNENWKSYISIPGMDEKG
ncbi:helix-turn-helix domain-containing protein [Pantoea ananatis]|uniref:helix-turn-helix domain-containing protein n=1 Tax=Pantoea ananas TaxID=553 RepID=UPI001B30BFE3|nr:helix-turn-helix transcriptional regulator [Pantoea ananatis]